MKKTRLNGCYYGLRQVIYVTVETPVHKPIKHLSVYGVPFDLVLKTIDHALAESYGKTKSNRPKGRPRKARK